MLAVSYLRLPAADWSGLPLRELLLTAAQEREAPLAIEPAVLCASISGGAVCGAVWPTT